MPATGLTLFETAIGWCGLAWGERGVLGVQLPHGSEGATRARLGARFPEAFETAPPPRIECAIQAIVALLAGEPRDLSDIPLDMEGVPAFEQRVYAIARTVGPGETTTYGEIAARLGEPSAARAVGQALGRNPFAIIVPCHRVLAAKGRAGGFSASGGVDTKLRMLSIERARTSPEPMLFDALPLVARPHRRA